MLKNERSFWMNLDMNLDKEWNIDIDVDFATQICIIYSFMHAVWQHMCVMYGYLLQHLAAFTPRYKQR